MGFLRFFVLIAALLAVYAAQYLFAQNSLEFLRSPWISENLPRLRDFTEWSPADRQNFGLYLGAIGALLFGLAAYGWSFAPVNDSPRTAERRPSRAAGGALIAVALAAGAGLLLYFRQDPAEAPWTHYLWVAAIALYLLGSWLAGDRAPAEEPLLSPESSWPFLLAIFVLVVFLLGWQLDSVPVRVDGDEASHGLQALAIAAGQESRIFAPGWANIPLLAYYPAALGMQLSGDWLLGNRLAGLVAGLLTVFGVWLLGCEFFRQTPAPEEGRDDGRRVALLAAAFTAIGYTFVHFGRMPQYLEPVGWGVLGLWALQRGVRTGSRPVLALSGLLMALAGLSYYSGRVFVLVALLWWLCLLLARRGWLSQVGWQGFGLWAGGGFVFASPVVGGWLHNPAAFLTRMQEVSIFHPSALVHMESVYGVQGINAVLLENLQRALLTFWIYGDKSTHFGWKGPMLDTLVAPLLLLGIGFLLLNLDRLQSWQMLGWLTAVMALGGLLVLNTPFWPRLLPALPVAGLICALAVDRVRATLMKSGAPWLGQFTIYLVVGLLVLAGTNNWVAWYEAQTVHGDPESYAGRAIRSLPKERTAVLFDTGSDLRGEWGERTVEFLAGGPYAGRRATIDANNWPVNLPPQSSVILHTGDDALAAEVQNRFPGGVFLLQRNRQGDPVLFVYQLP